MKIRNIVGLVLCTLLLFTVPLSAAAAQKGTVAHAVQSGIYAEWLRTSFPKLRSVEETKTRFVFASAPEVVKTRAVLNKAGESLTVYRFAAVKDAEKCKAMIKGSTLVYGGKTVYADSKFPVTYYANTEAKVIILYCGVDKKVDEVLKKTYTVAGNYGGYFDARHSIAIPGEADEIASPQTEDIDLNVLKQRADSVYVATVTGAPSWKGHTVNGSYALTVKETVRGIERTTLKLSGVWPGVMIEGRTYVVCIKHVSTENGATRLLLADQVYKSVFEIDGKGNVLPICEYGMKAPVKLEKFLKQWSV